MPHPSTKFCQTQFETCWVIQQTNKQTGKTKPPWRGKEDLQLDFDFDFDFDLSLWLGEGIDTFQNQRFNYILYMYYLTVCV